VEDISYIWSHGAATGNEYGLLAKILGVNEYDHQTGINAYVEEVKPSTYDPTITNHTPSHTQKRKVEEWERTHAYWYIQKGFLKGVTANLHDPINKQYVIGHGLMAGNIAR
jgi:hypothetical protein